MDGNYDHSEELPGEAMGKDDHSKTRRDGEEVIQDASDLVNLEQVIKGAKKIGRNNIGGDLESAVK